MSRRQPKTKGDYVRVTAQLPQELHGLVLERSIKDGISASAALVQILNDRLNMSRILVDLTKQLCGNIDADEIAELLAGASQPKVLREIIQAKLNEMRANAAEHAKAAQNEPTYQEVKAAERAAKQQDQRSENRSA